MAVPTSYEQPTPPNENGADPGRHNLEEDPICIVGMACRLPGDTKSPSGLWQLLMDKKSTQSVVPTQRYNIKGYYSPEGDKAGVMNVDGGYFLQEDVRQFDNEFFGINNIEAVYMDPQQRKLLEVTFECFENSGTSLNNISGSNTGVYVGNFSQDHLLMQVRDPDDLRRYHATGAGLTMLANRISHTFNLYGPSLTLDTACSSSLYCLHLACSALKSLQCDGAIVAASNLVIAPIAHVAAMKAGMLSPTSTCHSFDSSADGYARGEGINAIYLKRLSTAIQNADNIYAIVRGTAINSNGHTPGMVYPSVDQQAAVIRKAYHEANLDPSGTDYVECHGTGTELGDLVELTALASCFSHDRETPIRVGGNKPNLGHSEAASSLTSLIKIALNFQHSMLAPTCGVKMLNPKLRLGEHNMELVAEAQPWPRPLQRASICSFGYGGANSHAILESFHSYSNGKALTENQGLQHGSRGLVLPVSAASPGALEHRLAQMRRILEHCESSRIEQLCYTLAERLSHFEFRSTLLVSRPDSLQSWGCKMELPEMSNDSDQSGPLDFAFVFNGQGAQYHAMGKELLETSTIFLATIRELDQVIRGLPSQYLPDWTLEDTLRGLCDTYKVHEVSRSQSVCTALQIGLVNVLNSWGVRATVTVGHSSGEIAAAYASGIISASQAIIAAFFRGYAVGSLSNPGGGMLACGLSVGQAESLIKELSYSERVCIACVNSNESVTLSGQEECIRAIQTELNNRRIFCRFLETGGQAYHSSYMKAPGAKYEHLLEPYFQGNKKKELRFKADMYSTVQCGNDGPTLVDASSNLANYWRKNLESPVLFEPTLSHVLKKQRFHIVELGPHTVLKGPINQIRAAAKMDAIPYSPSLIRNQDAELSIKRLAAKLFISGYHLNWQAINMVTKQNQTVFRDLPPYPWDYSSGLRWFEPRSSVEIRNRMHIRHELLGSQQLNGNGVDWSWRNVLRVDEMPWLCDHNIDDQIIFPAAGYLAVAMEAISRIKTTQDGPGDEDSVFEFRNVSLSTALVLPEKDDLQLPIELHTTMSLRRLSSKKVSVNIYDFSISSWTAGHGVVHCVGNIKMTGTPKQKAVLSIPMNEHVQKSTIDQWYDKYTEEGMFFGPHFQMLTGVRSDRNHLRPRVECSTKDHPSKLGNSATEYPVHPLTIDACLQAAQISATCGKLDLFEVYVPVFITECRIRKRSISQSNQDGQGIVHAQSQRTGFATLRADSILEVSHGFPLIEMRGVQLLKYMGRIRNTGSTRNKSADRHPAFQISWKPDIKRLSSHNRTQIETQIENEILRQDSQSREQEIATTIDCLLDLVGHNNPRMRVLEIGFGNEQTKNRWLRVLGYGTPFPRFQSWDSLVSLDAGDILNENVGASTHDVLVFNDNDPEAVWSLSPDRIKSLLGRSEIVIACKSDTILSLLSVAGLSTIVVRDQVVLAMRKPVQSSIKGLRFVLLTRDSSSSSSLKTFITELEEFLLSSGAKAVETISIDQIETVDYLQTAVCVSFLEIEEPFLATLTQRDLDMLHILTNSTRHITWLTGANMLGTPRPDLTLVHGLARALMVEQPSLRFVVVDIGSIDELDHSFSNIFEAIHSVLVSREKDDKEFIYSDSILNVSRFEPYVSFNSLFQHRSRKGKSWEMLPLSAAHPARLSIGTVGLIDTLHFQQLCEPHIVPPKDYIDVQMKAVSLNAKDIYTMSGHVETRTGTAAIEFGGIVVATGPDVTNVRVGDRVVVVTPNTFSTIERVPSWTAHRILPDEAFGVMASLPTIYCAALYAIRDRAQLRRDESVLIHSGAGAFGIAAIAIARRTGAVIYTTAGSSERQKYLIESLNIPASHIFNSRDNSFIEGLKSATKGRGVDVVINSLTGDLMHDSWRCLAPFGRFIEVGKRELVDDGRLEMDVFARNTTFSAFDLTEMYFQDGEHYKGVVTKLIEDVFELYRAKQIRAVPIVQYDVAEIAQAYRFFSSRERIGKVVVSLENEGSLVQVMPPKYSTLLDSNKVYLLVGALGGLGRSLVQWMISRGAKNFVFLQRSGCDKPGVQEFLSQLENVRFTVVKGDVTILDDVVASVAACNTFGIPIGGVIQAAMALHEDLFSQMTSESWHASVSPKWAGTWNLHTAIDGYDHALDFFLMTSSMNGSVGIPTESNYCAANSFLDAFALWRRSQGKPATSLALGMISEVGYLHENPEIEALLLRKGIQPLNEKTLLQLVDLALQGATSEVTSSEGVSAHILTGLETTSIQKFHEEGFEVSHSVMDDPRSAILARALEASLGTQRTSDTTTPNLDGHATNASWLKGLPEGAAAALRTEINTASTLREAILGALQRRFSHLLLTPIDQIDPKRSFAQFGIDSMIAAEFRTWIWSSLKVEVPFLDLLSTQKSLATLAELLETQLKTEESLEQVSVSDGNKDPTPQPTLTTA